LEFLRGIFNRIREWFAGIWEKTEKRDRTRFVVISGVALVLLISALVVLNNNRFESLSVPPAEFGTASNILTESGISNRISGGELRVNRGDAPRAMAALVMSTNIRIEDDLSIFALGTGLTSTADTRQAYARYQKQTDLRRTLEAMDFISQASVHINEPDNRGALFAGEHNPATASVMLWLTSELNESQVRNLELFVAGATNVDPENVVLSDQFARPLNMRVEGPSHTTYGLHYQHRLMVEADLARAASRPLNAMFGSRNVTVEVFATLNFDDYSSESITFEPVVDDEGIPRSMQDIREYARGSNLPGGFPGTDENGLGMEVGEYPEVLENMASVWERTQITNNYEINQVVESLQRAQGVLEDLTISVAINSDGLEPEYMNTAAIQEIVAASIGLLPAQYAGRVIVRFVPMLSIRIEDDERAVWQAQLDRDALFAFIQTLVLYSLIGLCLLLIIWRTFALLKPQVIEIPAEVLAGDVGDYADLLEAAAATTELEVTKTPSRERIEEFIDTNPDAVANMLRSWLQEEEDSKW
jgi:flagellar M-ring protein FliF